jgi:hypothetical protein
LKLQNDLFLAVFSHYITKQGRFLQLDRKKISFHENAIQKTANLGAFKEWYSHYSPSMSI